jgi:hypothetical protein
MSEPSDGERVPEAAALTAPARALSPILGDGQRQLLRAARPNGPRGKRAASRRESGLDLRKKRRQPDVMHGNHDPAERLA